MANSKISALTSATTPLAGTETLPIVQSGVTKQVSVANLTAGRSVAMKTGAISYSDTAFGGGFTINNTATTGAAWARMDLQSGANSNLAIYQVTSGDGVINATGSNALSLNTASTARWSVASGGDLTFNTGNIIQGTAAKGINFTANTPAAGMTSQLLNWYEEGTWTPSTAFATFVGAASSSGTYTRVGRQVTVNGTLTGATSVTVGASGILTTSLPFNASYDSIGSMAASTNTASGVVRVTGAYVVAATTMAPVTSITFTATYFV